MSLYRVDASIRIEGSHSRQLADLVEHEWLRDNPNATVERRDLGREPIPAHVWADAVTGGHTPAEHRTAEQRDAVTLAAAETDRLAAADALLFAVPLYNFGVSQHLKTWIDLIITDPRMGRGASAIEGRPAVLVVARGGGYGPGTPREGWDHASGWIRRILVDVWRTDLTVVETELTLAGENPALAHLQPLADASRASAETAAAAAGTALRTPAPALA
jgi:FMN-dependent NADH-azoreductase